MKIEDEIKQKKFESDYQRVLVNLAYSNNWAMNRAKPVFMAHGLTMQQYNVLRILRGRYPEVCSASDVKEVMLDKSPDLTRLLDRLVIKKLITRKVCGENRRRVDLQITDNGLELLERMEPDVRSASDFSKNITQAEARQLSALLDKLRG